MYFTLLLICALLVLPVQARSTYSAVVTPKQATFTIPVTPRDRWTWRRSDTKDNQQEYRMDVTVKNEDREYTFGFYLWKHHGASSGSGTLSELITAGQKSLFERAESRRMTIVRDTQVKVVNKDNLVVISLRDKDYIQRLFSSKPSEVVFKIKIPGDADISQTVPVSYQ